MTSHRHPKVEPPVDPIRSKIMRAVPRSHTNPEMKVRRMLHATGLRFRMHRKDLPGTPDIVLPKHRTAIFVNGCFWHRHRNCRKAAVPKTRMEFWNRKFADNVARDCRNAQMLRQSGWRVLTIWQCEVEKPKNLQGKLERSFGAAQRRL